MTIDDPGLPHQPRDPLASDVNVLIGQLSMDLGTAVEPTVRVKHGPALLGQDLISQSPVGLGSGLPGIGAGAADLEQPTEG